MTKLELSVSAETLECVSYDEATARILGLPPPQQTQNAKASASVPPPQQQERDQQEKMVHISSILADEQEMTQFVSTVDKLTTTTTTTTTTSSQQQQQSPIIASPFETMNLVFKAPNAPEAALPSDRSPLDGCFPPTNPTTTRRRKAIHTSDHVQLSCFAHIYFDSTHNLFRISALEYSRNHRSQLLRQEFAAWLVEEHIEKSVIASKANDGTIVYWNRFATSLYQYEKDEAIGQDIRNLIASSSSSSYYSPILNSAPAVVQQQHQQEKEQDERIIPQQQQQGEGEGGELATITGMYQCNRKDQSQFMAHITNTPMKDDEGHTQFIVGVSDDYTPLYNVMTKLQQLNTNLETEVIDRTKQLLVKEKHIRMIGTAMKESDTGVLITDENYNITWCNDAVSRMLGLKMDVIMGMFPWDLPLQQEQKQDSEIITMDVGDISSHSNNLQQEQGNTSSSSLESYFLHEKAFNVAKSSSGSTTTTIPSSSSPPPPPLQTEGLEHHNNNKNANINNMVISGDAPMPDATMTTISTTTDNNTTGEDEHDAAYVGGGEASSSATTFTVSSPTPPTKRPPIAAICYRIDRPSRPLHIMVSVEVMPPEKPMRITRSTSSVRNPLQDALVDLSQMQVDTSNPSSVEETAKTSRDHQPSTVAEGATTTTSRPSTTGTGRVEPDETKASPQMQFMITLRDITAERKAEEAQLIAERASAANEAKTQMMQMLSHELRTPLQGIMGVASTSMMDIEDFDNNSNATNSAAGKSDDSEAGAAAAAAATNMTNNPGGGGSSSGGGGGGGGGGVKGAMYDSLSTILASSRLLLTLINNTLDTRKINADMMQKIELSTVSMMSCIRDSFQYCGPFAAINEAVLELSDPHGDNKVKLQQILNTSKSNLMSDVLKKKYNVVGNRLRLEQVIVNLLSNGIKYTTPGTSVVASVRNSTLAQVLEEMKAAPSSSLKFLSEEELKEMEENCAKNGGEVSIFSVRDHGKGIPPEEYVKVFGEFQQLDASAEKDNKYDGSGSGQSSGSGLGLNLSMKFVTLMHGHIWFQNCTDGGGGVTFSFYLNRARPQRESAIALSGREGEPGGQSSMAPVMSASNRSDSFRSDDQELQEDKVARIRVLVIDDSMINLKVLARMMTKLKVQHCQTALSGAAALEYLEPIRNDPSLVPNLILCDLQMPGMDGYELMIHLREMNICSSPIIMACSADWGSETEGKCHDVGFDGLLRKPITVTYLKEFLTNTKL